MPSDTERMPPPFKLHVAQFLEDPVAALRDVITALEEDAFSSTYAYLGLPEDWLDDWCVVLDEFVGKMVTELCSEQYDPETFDPLVHEVVTLGSTTEASLRLRLRLFKAAEVTKEKMVEYFKKSSSHLSNEQQQMIAELYDNRIN